jgi:hypothetical protein
MERKQEGYMLKFTDIKEGMVVKTLPIIDCIKPGNHVVQKDETGELFIPCVAGKHFLSGHECEDGIMFGMEQAE